jgi:copper transport protein
MGKSGAVPDASDSLVSTLIWLARIGLYLGLFAGVGGVFFEAWIAAVRMRSRTIVSALALGLFSAALSLGCQGLDLLGLPLGGIMSAAPWQAAIRTTLGPSLLVAAAAMTLSIFAQRSQSGRFARAGSVLAMAGIGAAFASSGHASTASPQWLTRPAVFLHAVGVAYWIGALVPLLAMVRRQGADLVPVLHRFSRGAVPVVGGLVLTGLALAIVQLESFRALIDTKYGWILSIKVALVFLLLGLAALNRFRLTPALTSDGKNTRPLARSVLLECAIVIGILAVVAGWRFTPPPRSLAAAIGPPLALHIHSDKAMFQVLVSSGKPGVDSFVLQIMTGDASPLQAKEVTLILSLPEKGIEPMERKATQASDGNWTVRDMPIPFAGRWHVRVEVLVTDFEKLTLEEELDVPAR